MIESKIICPNCSTEIKLTESLAAPLIEATRKEYEAKIAQKEQGISKRETNLKVQLKALEEAKEAIDEQKWAACIYYSYSSMVNTAKALLTAEKTKTNTHNSIIKDFNTYFIANGRIALNSSFEDLVLQLNQNEPNETFAKSYLLDAEKFLNKVESYRKFELIHA
jgi:uncharacterized protein (UPF0332 family)